MREKHNAEVRNVATINLQMYNASTKASIVALVRSCGHRTAQSSQLMENYVVVKFNSSQRVFQ
jgi:hypothetical protein